MVAESLFTVPATVSFPDAIALTQTLLDRMEQGTLTDTAVVAAVTALVHSETGARGFFVTYLSDDRVLADHLVLSLTEALRSAPTVVAPLLVKNLAMSTAMAITHRRNQDKMAANGSERVRSRTAQLIQALQLPQVQENAQALVSAIETGDGAYQTFLQRWGYDVEQQQAMRQALEANGLLEP